MRQLWYRVRPARWHAIWRHWRHPYTPGPTYSYKIVAVHSESDRVSLASEVREAVRRSAHVEVRWEGTPGATGWTLYANGVLVDTSAPEPPLLSHLGL